jgi:hypothetical protein
VIEGVLRPKLPLSMLLDCLGSYCLPVLATHIPNFVLTFTTHHFAIGCRHMAAMRHILASTLFTFAALSGASTVVRAATIEVEETVYEEVESGSERYVAEAFKTAASSRPLLASFGPFNMVAPDRAELIGSIESETPAQFRALLKAYPGLKQIDMIDCPGTGDDEANLALARMVRRAGIATYIPDGGSVRSGGVELFLAGAKRSAAPTAEFAVHSWMDEDGLEADDYAADDPANLAYINFYREMGMSETDARAFYAMTNSTPHDDALYLTGKDIGRYINLN